MLRRAIVLAAVVLAVLTSSCGERQEDASQQPTPGPSIDPDEVSKSVPSHLKLEVDGEVVLSYDADTPLRIVTIDEPGLEQVRFLSVGIETFKKIGDGQFRIAFDLVGVYDGPGTYELPKVGGDDEPAADADADAEEAAEQVAGDLSKPILTYYVMKDAASTPGADSIEAAHVFENAQQPCEVEVGRDARSGKLSCPEVADAEGKTVSIEMTWEPQS